MLSIVEGGVKHDGQRGVVTVESDLKGPEAIMELTRGGTARNMAIEAAVKAGLGSAGCEMTGSSGSTYPVDKEGNVVTDPKHLHRYRLDIPVVQRFT